VIDANSAQAIDTSQQVRVTGIEERVPGFQVSRQRLT
jgi:hypothetical protein